VQQLIDAIFATLGESGGVGLAAPQVFVPRRVFLACVGDEPREKPAEAFINPEIVARSDAVEAAWEGCLSFPELQVLVERHASIVVEFLDCEAKPRRMELNGFAARVVQHEFDHLEGVLTIDRAKSTRDIVKASELPVVMQEWKTGPGAAAEE
jgi:peptide deformylase